MTKLHSYIKKNFFLQKNNLQNIFVAYMFSQLEICHIFASVYA